MMWVEALGLFMSLIYNQAPVTCRQEDVEMRVPLCRSEDGWQK